MTSLSALTHVPLPDLVADVKSVMSRVDPSHLIVFDVGGVTGRSDHDLGTQAALAASEELDVAVMACTVAGTGRRGGTEAEAVPVPGAR